MTCCQIVRFDVQLSGVSRRLTAQPPTFMAINLFARSEADVPGGMRWKTLRCQRRKMSGDGGSAKVAATAMYCEQKAIDIALALARMDGDVDLLKDLLALFLEGLPKMLGDLREAVTARDAKAIEFTAHELKGSVGNFAAHPAFGAALKLEAIGRDGKLCEAEQAYAELENEIDRFTSAIDKFHGTKMMIQ